LTRQIAAQYAAQGIRANAIAPANIDTPMLGTNTPQMRESMFERALVKRLGKPEEVAEVVVFLASPHTDYITGQVIGIDGGWGAT
jgi:3-oxoacyl-[acyl-carrier protein] reductase